MDDGASSQRTCLTRLVCKKVFPLRQIVNGELLRAIDKVIVNPQAQARSTHGSFCVVQEELELVVLGKPKANCNGGEGCCFVNGIWIFAVKESL
jgi:hypothetical protein